MNQGEIRFNTSWSAANEHNDQPVDSAIHSGILVGNDMNISNVSKAMIEYNLGVIPRTNISYHDVISIKFKRIDPATGNSPTANTVIIQGEYEFNGYGA